MVQLSSGHKVLIWILILAPVMNCLYNLSRSPANEGQPAVTNFKHHTSLLEILINQSLMVLTNGTAATERNKVFRRNKRQITETQWDHRNEEEREFILYWLWHGCLFQMVWCCSLWIFTQKNSSSLRIMVQKRGYIQWVLLCGQKLLFVFRSQRRMAWLVQDKRKATVAKIYLLPMYALYHLNAQYVEP